jgi:hypothetical protein
MPVWIICRISRFLAGRTAVPLKQTSTPLLSIRSITRCTWLIEPITASSPSIRTPTSSWEVATFGNPSTNGVLIAADLQQLIVTDGKANVFAYDLRVPQAAPDKYVVPNITAGTDALTYDPLNRTVYAINGTAPYYITGIDLACHFEGITIAENFIVDRNITNGPLDFG